MKNKNKKKFISIKLIFTILENIFKKKYHIEMTKNISWGHIIEESQGEFFQTDIKDWM